jgi:hypothetical protein
VLGPHSPRGDELPHLGDLFAHGVGRGRRRSSSLTTLPPVRRPSISGTGTGTNPPLAIDSRFFSCANGVCDIGASHNVFVNNFFTTTFTASGGTAPYTWSGQVPAGLTLRVPLEDAVHVLRTLADPTGSRRSG